MANSPFESVANALKDIIDNEFAPEGYKVIFDNLHESLGRQAVAVGVAPMEEAPWNDALALEIWVEVRFYDLWKQEISPDTVVNPTRITAFAERLRDAVRRYNKDYFGTSRLWFFDLQRIQYPNDPTGNKTRFHATIRAYGNNAGLVETSG